MIFIEILRFRKRGSRTLDAEGLNILRLILRLSIFDVKNVKIYLTYAIWCILTKKQSNS